MKEIKSCRAFTKKRPKTFRPPLWIDPLTGFNRDEINEARLPFLNATMIYVDVDEFVKAIKTKRLGSTEAWWRWFCAIGWPEGFTYCYTCRDTHEKYIRQVAYPRLMKQARDAVAAAESRLEARHE